MMPKTTYLPSSQKDAQRYVKQSPGAKRTKPEAVEQGSETPLHRYENAVLRYQKPKSKTKRQASRERQQQHHQHQQQNHGYSSSDESVVRNKSKSISSIDTQSVNNILDEYEDLDCRRSSDLSDVGSISVSNFEAVMMDQQKKQDKPKVPTARSSQPKCSPVREKPQPVLKVNQQTQVRQRSRERQKDCPKHLAEDSHHPPTVTLTVEASRGKVPEVLLRKGEVQKRVDEWLSQAQSQNYPREKPLTRSNSSADQKTQRRYRQDSRSRSIDEGRDKLNGTSSSYDDLSRAEKKVDRKVDKVNVAVNTSRGTYKEYLALKTRSKQQDYGFSASSNLIGRARDCSPSTASRIPQRGPLSSSFRSRRIEASNEDGQTENEERGCRSRAIAASPGKIRTESSDYGRISGVASTSTGSSPSVIPCRRASFKRSPSISQDQSSGGASSRPLVKEETGPRPRVLLASPVVVAGGSVSSGGGSGGGGGGGGGGPKGPGSLGDQGEPISPNKDGESRRPGPGDKPAGDSTAACKSMDVSRSDRSARMLWDGRERRDGAAGKSEQQRQETGAGYGTVVGARLRSLQGQQEPRVARARNHQAPAEARKPPVLPRRDSSSAHEGKTDRKCSSPLGSPQSTFKPNNAVYGALQQLNEQNAAKSKPHYTSSNHVEKIYERSLQPQVIHADDLESLLRPSLQVSAYGEQAEAETKSKEPREEKEEEYERIGELRYEQLETIEEDDQKSEASVCRYPEVGLNQLKIPGLANGRSKPVNRRESISPRRDQSDPVRTFVTFQAGKQGVQETAGSEEHRDAPEPIMVLEDADVPAYETLDRSHQSCHTRENSNLSTATIPLDELESERQAKFKAEEGCCARLSADQEEARHDDGNQEKVKNEVTERVEPAKDLADRVEVVNEVLLKNLQFKQDLPAKGPSVNDPSPPRAVEAHQAGHQQKPAAAGFHNVLCDNYEIARDARLKENKVYVTKEEMERQRLMDLLRKGDVESVKA
ncbi:uncharacterized protein LOC144478062, partial [Augochlora pura]